MAMQELLRSPEGGHVVYGNDGDLYVQVSGRVDVPKILRIVEDIATLPGASEKNDLWDFRGCSVNLDLLDILDMVRTLQSMQDRWSHRKTAVLANPGFRFSLAKLVTQFASFKFDFRVFTDEKEAFAWLKAEAENGGPDA